MKVRELLQTEIWSKRTTRKFLVWSEIVFVLVVVVLGTLFAVERNWISPGERSTARVALRQIDDLQNFGSISDEDFHTRASQAEAQVKIAGQAARTVRDKYVNDALWSYLTLTAIHWRHVRMRRLMQQEQVAQADSARQSDEEFDSKEAEVRDHLRSVLHKELD